MSGSDIIPILPLIFLGGASILSLLASAFIRKAAASFAISVAGMAAALAGVCNSWAYAPRSIGVFLTLDRFSVFTMGLILAASMVTAISAFGDIRGRDDDRGEYFSLLTLAGLGAAVLASAQGFPALFLGLELLSVSLFTLISWKKESVAGSEAGIKYLLLSGVSSAFLFFGMALAYHELGSMALSAVAESLARGEPGFLLIAGLGLMTVGICFKLGVVPFHFWTPDVYDGAPSHVAGFLATASKGAAAVILVRLFGLSGIASSPAFTVVFASISGATMIVGNFLALRETNVKRILAYSSIAHFGYLLIAFVAGGSPAVLGVSYFLTAYFASTLAAFSSVTALSRADRDADRIEDYRGLAERKPWLAACFTVSLLSLAGLPLTSGFMGKLILIAAGEGALQWILVVLLVLNSSVSLFYYLKIVSAMYRPAIKAGDDLPATAGIAVRPRPQFAHVPAGIAILVSVAAILCLGIYPAPLMNLIELLVAG